MKIILFSLLVLFTLSANGQFGNLETLQSKNGYKGILLGSDISTLKSKLSVLNDKKLDADSCINYTYDDSSAYKITDNISLLAIGIKSYKNKIISITLIYNQSNGYDILFLFEKAFGRPIKYNQFMDSYQWHSEKVDLSLNFEGRSRYAIYTCNPLQSQIDQIKLKKNTKAVSDL